MNSHPKRKFNEVDNISSPTANDVDGDRVIRELEGVLGLTRTTVFQDLENILGLNANEVVSDEAQHDEPLVWLNQLISTGFEWPDNFNELLSKAQSVALWEQTPSSLYLHDVANVKLKIVLGTFNNLHVAIQHLLVQTNIPYEIQKLLINLSAAIEFKKFESSLLSVDTASQQTQSLPGIRNNEQDADLNSLLNVAPQVSDQMETFDAQNQFLSNTTTIANFSLFPKTAMGAPEAQEVLLHLSKEEVNMLMAAEKILRTTPDKSIFEDVWQANQEQFNKWLKGTRIYTVGSGFRSIGKTELHTVFNQMLKLKVDSSIVQQILLNNVNLMEFINDVNYSNKTSILHYLNSLNNDTKNINFIKYFVNDIVNNETILQYLNQAAIAGLKSNSKTKEEQQILNLLKNLTDHKLLLLQLDKDVYQPEKHFFNNK